MARDPGKQAVFFHYIFIFSNFYTIYNYLSLSMRDIFPYPQQMPGIVGSSKSLYYVFPNTFIPMTKFNL
jgi:hypothetical protein